MTKQEQTLQKEPFLEAGEKAPETNHSLLVLLIWLLGTMGLWWFAFYDGSTGEQSEWLQQARAACFGTDAHGLPNAGGWLLLTLAPLLFLVSVFIAFGEDLKSSLLAFSRPPLGKGALVIIGLLTIAHTAWATQQVMERQAIARATELPFQVGSFPDNYPRTFDKAPDFSLVNYHGETVALSEFKGRNVILTFAFAHCATVCPTLISSAKKALTSFPNEDVQLVVVTIDPWRDTPSALQSIHEKWDLPENAVVLSGSEEDIQRVLAEYNYTSQRDEKTGDVIHPATMYVISADGILSYTFNNPSSTWLAEAISRVTLVPNI